MTIKRRTLEDFTCMDTTSYCHDACDGFMDCEIGEAYREYLKLLKCARLLRVFERRAEPTLARALDYYYVSGLEREQFEKLTAAIRDALRAAGLE